MQNFDFYALDFVVLRDLNFSCIHNFKQIKY